MSNSYGIIEVDMFPEDVNSLDHPYVVQFKEILEEVAEEYNCNLVNFDIEHGIVMFSFDSEELTAQILNILQHEK
ncbi:MAG TPA: hypothetical protein PK874_07910 [Desulfobacteraceae bacterium]|nr:hypothetical protein [Desulfobacteraceae bacterium]HPJ67105.1 hypothetical protein [Desulfobacteraceae bacterium]HPQ29675.1 hypothetical protein [Desulfobacteraceae bacterium]